MSEQDVYSATLPMPAARRAAPAMAARPSSLGTIIARIEEAVVSETASIRTDVHFDLKASNARKSRYLYDLHKALKDVRGDDVGPAEREGVARLRVRLEENQAAIRAHLDAVNEVAALLQDAIERSEADGTYSTGAFGRAAAR